MNVDARVAAFADAARADRRAPALADAEPGHAVAVNLAAFEQAEPALPDGDARAPAVVDVASDDGRVGAARDGEADVGVARDFAVLDAAPRAVEEVEAGVGAVADAAAADDGRGRLAVDADAGERCRSDVAVFEHKLAARD